MQSDVIVTVCPPETLHVAQRLLLSDSIGLDVSSPNSNAKRAPLDQHGILVAREGETVLGAIYHQLGSGRVAWIWAPAFSDADRSSSASKQLACMLVIDAIKRLAERGALLIQVLLGPGDCRGDIFAQCGFRHITDMVRMEREVAASIDPESSGRIEFVRFSDSLIIDLCDVIEQTYQDSQDCPELDGVRPISEVLAGYRAAGEFRDELWWLVRSEGRYVGCVLLCHFPENWTASLQYMGVVPAYRGRGLGRELTRHVLHVASRLGARKINLGVDARNTRAIRVYDAKGFEEVDRQSVFIMDRKEARGVR